MYAGFDWFWFVLHLSFRFFSSPQNLFQHSSLPLATMPIDLYFPCPHCDDNTAYHWVHVACGQRTTVNDSGLIGCRGNGPTCKDYLFKDCRWGCKNHDYKPADPNKFAIKLAIVLAELTNGLLDGSWSANEVRTLSKALKAIAKTL